MGSLDAETRFQVGDISVNRPEDPIFENFTDALAEAKRRVVVEQPPENGLWAVVWVLTENELPWVAVAVNTPTGGAPILFWGDGAKEFRRMALGESETEYLVRMTGEGSATPFGSFVEAKVYAESKVIGSVDDFAYIYLKDVATNRTHTLCIVRSVNFPSSLKVLHDGEAIFEVGEKDSEYFVSCKGSGEDDADCDTLEDAIGCSYNMTRNGFDAQVYKRVDGKPVLWLDRKAEIRKKR